MADPAADYNRLVETDPAAAREQAQWLQEAFRRAGITFDGTPMRHATWAECERRVKGRSGARFKKAASAEDERVILRGWQVDPGSL